ncbi:hypothetical protein [Halobacterium yunchengense]|uniref:hypothetical protein n=1 Tax=Halobacterium yunchengense TaxID=3108497 RepID=UPI00300AC190
MSSTDCGWRDVTQDPDPVEDLGYDLIELDVIHTETAGRPRVLVLPADEDLLREDAFVVAAEDAVCDLETMV